MEPDLASLVRAEVERLFALSEQDKEQQVWQQVLASFQKLVGSHNAALLRIKQLEEMLISTMQEVQATKNALGGLIRYHSEKDYFFKDEYAEKVDEILAELDEQAEKIQAALKQSQIHTPSNHE